MNLLERKVFQHYWDDGLLDLFAAVGVLVMGFCWLRDLPVGAAIIPAMLAPLWAPARRRFIEPRLGLVEFTDAREQRNRKMLKLVLYLGIGSLILGVGLFFFRDALPINPTVTLIAGLPAVLLAVMAIVTSVLVNSARFLVYALILAVAGVIGAFLGWTPGLILTSAGVPMLAIAVVLLARFIRLNPVDPGVAE